MTADEVIMVDDLLELESGLSEWEMEFVESLSRLDHDIPLSPRQKVKLEQIVEERL
jgi:hypothetical protein